MGHTRLGEIPTNKKWKEVVGLIALEVDSDVASRDTLADDIERIASQTLNAAQAGLQVAVQDKGLRYTFYLLTQLVLATRQPDWESRLAKFGIRLPTDASLFDFTACIHNSIDDYVSKHGRPTDISEMAQQAAGEAISTLAGPRASSLFGTDKEDIKAATREVSTKKGFSELGQLFFGRFMARFLNFYLSRETAKQTGGDRLQQIGDLSKFNDALYAHCKQSAKIVHDFCGEWYSKTEFKEGISLENTSRFMAVALQKLQAELGRQGAEQ